MKGINYFQVRKSCLFTKPELLHLWNGSAFPPRGQHYELIPVEEYDPQELWWYERRVKLTCIQIKDKALDLICDNCDQYRYPSVVGKNCLWCHQAIRKVRCIANHFRLCPETRGVVNFCRGMCQLQPIII